MPDPTVTDVFNQLVLVNGKLSQVEVNTSLMANLNMSINAGFSASVGRLDTLTAVEIESAKLLFHLTAQNETIICMLDQISRNTCSMLNEMATQTELQKRMAQELEIVSYVVQAGNPAAMLDHARHKKLEEKIERCCPPPTRDPACKYTPCAKPETVKEPRLPEIPKHDDRPNPSVDMISVARWAGR
jgi:hypothetical protein